MSEQDDADVVEQVRRQFNFPAAPGLPGVPQERAVPLLEGPACRFAPAARRHQASPRTKSSGPRAPQAAARRGG
jgi:hypothetical protein